MASIPQREYALVFSPDRLVKALTSAGSLILASEGWFSIPLYGSTSGRNLSMRPNAFDKVRLM
jgi:hypothetical protein